MASFATSPISRYSFNKGILSHSSQSIFSGIATIGEKLGIDVLEDIRILVLLWKMDCNEKPGCITAEEWTKGCDKLRVDSWDALKKQLPALDTGFLERAEFRDLYKFCFKFNLSGTHRTLQKEVVVDLLKMTLKDRIAVDRIESLISFLNSTDNYSQITMDQWCSVLDFFNEIGDDDADITANYDQSTSAWPVMIDDYVEYIDKKQQS
jgi:Cullin binding